MLALITKLDGTNALLFHVEHCGKQAWQYQACWPASRLAALQDWSPSRAVTGERAIEPLADPNVPVLVRWRRVAAAGGEGDAPPEEPWQDAQPREWGEATVSFHVIVKQPRDFRADPLVHATALVRGLPIAFELVMPRRMVAESGQEILTVSGTALGAGPATVFREPGEFSTSNAAFAISNAGPSQVTLHPVPARPPESLPFSGTYAVKLGTLPPEEIELLRAYVAEREQTANPPAARA